MRGFLLALLTCNAVLPPGICACRLDALLWAALTKDRLPECIDDPYEHDHHCPGAKYEFVQGDQTSPADPGIATPLAIKDSTLQAGRREVSTLALVLDDFAKPPLILTLCALRI